MRIRVNFGLLQSRQVEWWDSIENFPHLIKVGGVKYEFVFWDKDLSKQYDWILHFSEVMSYDPNYVVDCDTWESRFGHQDKCECGARHTSFPWAHMFYCPEWKPWNRL